MGVTLGCGTTGLSAPTWDCPSQGENVVWNKNMHLISLRELIGVGTSRKSLKYIFCHD